MDPIEIQSQEELSNYLNEFGSKVSLRSRRSLNCIPEGEKIRSISKSQEFSPVPVACSSGNRIDESSKKKLSFAGSDCERDIDKSEEEDDIDDDGNRCDVGEDGKRNDRQGCRRYLGLVLALLACVAFSLSSLIVKYFNEYHPFSKCVWRFHGLAIPAIPMMIYSRCYKKEFIFDTIFPPCEDQRWKNIMFLVARAAAGFATIIFQFYALQYITLADQLVIVSSQPVFVTIVAYFMLGEKAGIIPIIMCVLTIAGVGIVTRPPILTGADGFDEDVLIGTGFSVASMAMSVGSIVFMRRMKEIHFTIILLTFAVFSMAAAGIAAAILGVFQLPNGENHILLAVIMAGLVFVSQTCTTLALKHEQAGLVSLTRASTIVFAFGWQFIFLGVVPDRFSIIGASIITAGVVMVAVRKYVSTLPEKSKARRRLRFLLK